MAKKRRSSGKKIGILFLIVAAMVGVASYYFYMADKDSAKVFFFKKDGTLDFVKRHVPNDAKLISFVADELLAGPSVSEKESGYFSLIPKSVKILTATKEKDQIILNFSKEIGLNGAGSTRVDRRLSQIVYTFTEISGVKYVQILVDGEEGAPLGDEGFIIEKPLSRTDVSSKI